jgi:hypothetical protein
MVDNILWTSRDQKIADSLGLERARIELDAATRDRSNAGELASIHRRAEAYDKKREAFLRYHNAGTLPDDSVQPPRGAGPSSPVFGGGGGWLNRAGDIAVSVHPRMDWKFNELKTKADDLVQRRAALNPADQPALLAWQNEAHAYNEMLIANMSSLAPAVGFPFVSHATRVERLPLLDVPPKPNSLFYHFLAKLDPASRARFTAV